MKLKVYFQDPLNEQASVLVDAQTDIKTAVKQGVLSALSADKIKRKLNVIIESAVARIRSPTLKKDARKSLMQFANKVYADFVGALYEIPYVLLPSVVVLMRAISEKKITGGYYRPETPEERKSAELLNFKATDKGIPLQEFQKIYISRVDTALQTLARQRALDPNDFTGRNSLRNLAEMQVRYERHQEEIQSFKNKKVKLVVCSVHADCSDRCAKWQGGVYSLDGTSGVTEDGKSYQPLENATDIYYTTKAGRTYKNGLLGFNCRHKLYEYKAGMVVPTVSKTEQKREYVITLKQREMEREVISAREIALAAKGVATETYRKWRDTAALRYKEYQQFSKEHNRAYYPDRVKIL